MRSGGRGIHWVMGPFVALASVAYIFRFPGPIGDLSLFRIALFVYAFCAITKILVSSSAVVRGDVVRLVVSGALIVAPTIIDVIFLTNDQALIRVVYLFWVAIKLT